MSLNTKILALLLVLAIGAVLVYTVFTIGTIVALFLMSLLFAFILAPAVNWIEGKGIARGIAAFIIFSLFFGGIAVAVYFLSPFIFDEVSHLQEVISVGQLRKGIRDVEVFLSRQLAFLGVRRMQVAPKVTEWVSLLFDNILNIASSLAGIVLFAVMMLISTFFLLKDARNLKKSLVEYVPNRLFEVALNIMHKIEWSLGAYLRGILVDSLTIGIVTTFALWLIDLPYYFIIGGFAAMANLVPYLGPPSAAFTASFVSVVTTGSFRQVPLILFVFVVIRLLDDAIVQPLTISKSVRLHPVIIIFALLVGGQLFGIVGMFFAVPTVGVLKVIIGEFSAGLQRYRPSTEQ
ncbi:MAG: AI-2E family transporter [Ignavibacteria bacterium]|nr:AI-2E family transporter [Ignavibacteria bacterium]